MSYNAQSWTEYVWIKKQKKNHITSLTEQVHFSPLTYLPSPGLVPSSASLSQHRRSFPAPLGAGNITEPPALGMADETFPL